MPEITSLFALANDFKEGDLHVGGTRDDQVRAEAKRALAALTLGDINRAVFVADGVSVALAQMLDTGLAEELAPLTVAEARSALLSERGAGWARKYRAGLSSETIGAVVKVMSNEELSLVARKISNPLPGVGVSIGAVGHFGSRIQPNSPGDDDEEILFSILEGLSYGCGDVIIGLNPASDDVDAIIRLEDLLRSVVERLQLPTRYCVLSDLVKQDRARAQTRVEVGFQSLAGTSQALQGMVGLDFDGVADLAGGFEALYFETGQGAEVTNGGAGGVDMVTLEARCYGVARALQKRTGKWLIVNDVAGFIGPEVFRTGAQLIRACLEDVVMAKLHGLTMGLDICATFHTGIEPLALQQITAQVVGQAAPAYLMAVAGNADPMLGYLTTSFREHPRLRESHGRSITTAMQQRLNDLGGDTAMLYAAYKKNGGEKRTVAALCEEARRKITGLQSRGFDIGYGADAVAVEKRLEALYQHARHALYAQTDEQVIRDVAPVALRVRTQARDRDDYLKHPPSGERLCDKDADIVRALYLSRRPQVQIVLSDGLNANALNANLRQLLPPLRHELAKLGCQIGKFDILVANGRVRAGYHIGALLDVEVIIHLIGERPGTGWDLLSAYLTYGRDAQGASRWHPGLEHSCTTAICGINPRGKPPVKAAREIAASVNLMLVERASGVALTPQ